MPWNTSVEIPKHFKDIFPINKFLEIEKDIQNSGWLYTNQSFKDDPYRSWTQSRKNRPIIVEASKTIQELLEEYLDTKLIHLRIHFNGQTIGQNGTMHQDYLAPGFFTFVLFANSFWNIESGGETYVLHPDGKSHIFPVVPNSGVLFPSEWFHWGNAPTVGNLLRITVAYSYVMEDYYNKNEKIQELVKTSREDFI